MYWVDIDKQGYVQKEDMYHVVCPQTHLHNWYKSTDQMYDQIPLFSIRISLQKFDNIQWYQKLDHGFQYADCNQLSLDYSLLQPAFDRLAEWKYGLLEQLTCFHHLAMVRQLLHNGAMCTSYGFVKAKCSAFR